MSCPYAEVIGDPISHSKSPIIHNFWLHKLGIYAEYRACRVEPAGLGDYLAARRSDPNWRGCNVTIPHKVAIVSRLDHFFPEAKLLGAVNTVVNHDGLSGANTDMRGFAEPFRDRFPERGKALLIGTGGAARAIFIALAGLDFEPVMVAGRSLDSVSAFLDVLNQEERYPQTLADSLPPVDVLVNATPLGMAGMLPLDIDLSPLPPTAIVYDIVYSPLETGLLRQARQRGLRTIDGLTMLIGQADAAFQHFFGGIPPRQHDGELRALLTA